MSRKAFKESFIDAKTKEIRRNNVQPGYVPRSNPNGLQATNRNSRQGPGTSGTRRVVTPARHQHTSRRAEALSKPERERHRPVFIEETHPGVVTVPGIGDDGLTIEEAYEEQSTIAPNEDSTVQVIAHAVDPEEENWRRHELDQAVREQYQMQHKLDQAARERDRMRRELDQAARERDQLRQMFDNAPVVTSVVATNRDVEEGDENVNVNHDDLQTNDDPKCDKRGRRWFAVCTILLIVIAIVAVILALVLPVLLPALDRIP